jgi:hypothetical protein
MERIKTFITQIYLAVITDYFSLINTTCKPNSLIFFLCDTLPTTEHTTCTLSFDLSVDFYWSNKSYFR